MEYLRYETHEPMLPPGGLGALSDTDLNEVVTFRLRERNLAEESLESAVAEQRRRGLA